MAKINATELTIRVSKLVKDTDPVEPALSPELVEQLKQAIQELAGAGSLVEFEEK